MWLKTTVVLLCVLVAGCRRAGNEPAGIEVTDDPAAIAAARAAFDAKRLELLSRALSNPGGIRSWDSEVIEVVTEHRSRSLEALHRIRDDRRAPPDRRMQALLALRFLGESPAVSDLVALASGNAAASLELCGALDDLYTEKDELPPAIRRALAAWVSSPEDQLRRSALRVVAWRRVDEAAESVLAQLPSAIGTDEPLFLAAARLRPSASLLKHLIARLGPNELGGGPSGLGSVTALGQSASDPALRRRAAEAASTHLTAQKDRPWIDGETLGALDMIASLEPPEEARRLLAELVLSARWEAVRRSALRHLAERDLAFAAELSKRSGVELPDDEAAAETGSALSKAEAARILVEEDVLTSEEASTATSTAEARSEDAEEAEEAEEEEMTGALEVLQKSGRLLAFDAETGTVPNRHDLLILEFSRASAGRFRPEAVLEDYVSNDDESETGRYMVQFVHAGRLYRFHPRDLGDWYDVDACVAAIHRALADAAIRQEFVMIGTGDQTAIFAFGPRSSLRAAGARLGIDFADDLDSPRKAGKAFEDQVRREVSP